MTSPADDPRTPLDPLGGDGPGSDSGSLFRLLYAELRAMAQHELGRERVGHTLDATALVHEAFVRLSDRADGGGPKWNSPGAFFSVAAQVMRRVLVDHARTRGRAKRGGGREGVIRESLTAIAAPDHSSPVDVLALDQAMNKLALEDPIAARVVEMRFFAGLEERIIGEALGISERTVRRHWTFAKAWLFRELGRADHNPAPNHDKVDTP